MIGDENLDRMYRMKQDSIIAKSIPEGRYPVNPVNPCLPRFVGVKKYFRYSLMIAGETKTSNS